MNEALWAPSRIRWNQDLSLEHGPFGPFGLLWDATNHILEIRIFTQKQAEKTEIFLPGEEEALG